MKRYKMTPENVEKLESLGFQMLNHFKHNVWVFEGHNVDFGVSMVDSKMADMQKHEIIMSTEEPERTRVIETLKKLNLLEVLYV